MFGLGHQDTYHVNYQHEGGFDVASSARRCARRSPTCLSSMRKADAEQTGGADADYSDLASAAQTGGADAKSSRKKSADSHGTGQHTRPCPTRRTIGPRSIRTRSCFV